MAEFSDTKQSDGDRRSFPVELFVPLILRLYEQAEQTGDATIRTECLDWWDRLLAAGVGGARRILGELDAGAGQVKSSIGRLTTDANVTPNPNAAVAVDFCDFGVLTALRPVFGPRRRP